MPDLERNNSTAWNNFTNIDDSVWCCYLCNDIWSQILIVTFAGSTNWTTLSHKNKFKVHAFILFVRRGICIREIALNSVVKKIIARKWKFVQNILFWNSSRWAEICLQLPNASYRPKDYFKNWLKRALSVCHLYVVLLMFWCTGFVTPNYKAI